MSDDKKLKPLSERHREFLYEYLKDFNGRRAYQDVYGCTAKAAESKASALVCSDKFKAHLDIALAERERSTKTDATYVVEYVKHSVYFRYE